MEMYNHICEYYLKFTGTSMMSLVVKLVTLSRYDASDKNLFEGNYEGKLMFPEILYVAVFLMMLKVESVVKDKITLIVNENIWKSLRKK